jgi:ectoine hydroxylase-related dioxygenase (phytanoyl-CoA dioxygenase family)
LTDAGIEEGCLAVLPRSHRQGLLPHCPASATNKTGFGVHVPDRYFAPEAAVPMPMKRGDALFMTRRTLHCSLSNHSDRVRFSYDLRYNPTGQPTGRGAFPGFVARSRAHPETELRDPARWTELWRETRHDLAAREDPRFNRWDAASPACA